jgi:hypothetical protein
MQVLCKIVGKPADESCLGGGGRGLGSHQSNNALHVFLEEFL